MRDGVITEADTCREFVTPRLVEAGWGAVHAVWGVKSWSAGLIAALSTTLLGAALGVVYLAGGRSLAPCVVANTLITALIEPGLIPNRLGRWRETPGSDDDADHATGTLGEGLNN